MYKLIKDCKKCVDRKRLRNVDSDKITKQKEREKVRDREGQREMHTLSRSLALHRTLGIAIAWSWQRWSRSGLSTRRA